jgi:hypothetical protein
MKSPQLLLRVSILSLGILSGMIAIAPAQAQWHSDSTTNTVVCDTIGIQDHPAIVADGSNGAIVVWEDNRNGAYYEIYGQHLNALGHEMWKHNGIRLGHGGSNEQSPIIATDDSGGAYIAWMDNRFTLNGKFGVCLFGQHVRANGTLMYPDTGLPVRVGKNECKNPVICDDGSGKAYIAWEDNRSPTNTTQPDIYMNRMWTGGVKFGLTTGTTGYIKNVGSFGHALWRFFDGSATFKSDIVGLQIVIANKGTYTINAVVNDTALDLVSIPTSSATNLSYTIKGPVGMPVDTERSSQTHPAITNDGAGGCVIAWTTGATIPTSIAAMRLDSNRNRLWNPPIPQAVTISLPDGNSNYSSNVNHVAMRRDGSEIVFVWEVQGPTSTDSTDIRAQRIRIADSSKVWSGGAIEVTGSMPYAQYSPQVFLDDSAFVPPGTGTTAYNGMIVVFETDNPFTGTDVAMIRIQADLTSKPAAGYVYPICNQPNGQVGFRATPINGGSSLLVAWDDGRKTDTAIYAQRVDRTLKRYFPTVGSTWGMPVSVDPNNSYQKKQVVLASHQFGAIAAWTDFRNGTNPDIFAQWIYNDSVLPIELESFTASCHHISEVNLNWKTANEHDCAGFEIERRRIDGLVNDQYTYLASFTDNNSLRGAGTTNLEHSYVYPDQNVEPGIYEYRLVDVALDGTRSSHGPVRVDASYGDNVGAWQIGPNQPNPFVDRTVLPIALPIEAIVDLTISDVTGRIVATPVAHQLLSTGVHEISLSTNMLGEKLASGSYVARMSAYDPTTGELLWHSAHPIMMAKVR